MPFFSSNHLIYSRSRYQASALLALCLALGGCIEFGASGPSASKIANAGNASGAQPSIRVVDLDDSVVRKVSETINLGSFASLFESARPVGSVLGPGDLVDVTIWEAPPAALFGAATDPRGTAGNAGTRSTTIPEQMIDVNGKLTIPFAGAVTAAGLTPSQVEQLIVARLIGIANKPQIIVRLVKNATANVTVVGEVNNSTRMSLSPKGERLLDALAAAGGARQPVSKTMIQISRGGRVFAMPLDAVIKSPAQNIILAPDDVVTAYYQPFSFTALGAVTQNAEVPFEATGLNLAQALGRIGGLNDEKANARGVFIFRFEDPSVFTVDTGNDKSKNSDEKIAVIYRIDLKDPSSLFLAQRFPIRNGDILYVSKSPATDLQKFLSIVSSATFSVLGVTQNF